VPAGEIGVVIAQVGAPLPIGAKSAAYKSVFGNFSNVRSFVGAGGQKGVQRPVLPPGTLVPIHPVGFLVITKSQVYGLPVSTDLQIRNGRNERLTCKAFGLEPKQLEVVRIEPQVAEGEIMDMVGIITAYEAIHFPPATSRAASADSATSASSRPAASPTRSSSSRSSGRRTSSTITTRTSSGFSRRVAASACNTTRCSTAATP